MWSPLTSLLRLSDTFSHFLGSWRLSSNSEIPLLTREECRRDHKDSGYEIQQPSSLHVSAMISPVCSNFFCMYAGGVSVIVDCDLSHGTLPDYGTSHTRGCNESITSDVTQYMQVTFFKRGFAKRKTSDCHTYLSLESLLLIYETTLNK